MIQILTNIPSVHELTFVCICTVRIFVIICIFGVHNLSYAKTNHTQRMGGGRTGGEYS
jgi:hypothetical protein